MSETSSVLHAQGAALSNCSGRRDDRRQSPPAGAPRSASSTTDDSATETTPSTGPYVRDACTFTVSDPFGKSTHGRLQNRDPEYAGPVVDTNLTLPVSIGGEGWLEGRLGTVALDTQPAHMNYTVLTAPTHGSLLKNGEATTSFIQADIDNHLVQYRENGDAATSDGFTFTVSDAAGNPKPSTSPSRARR